ncbi:MAG TPA: Ig domain-containing protein [Chthoniobacteraceae bacterium]|jgi:hypothetical protein|nr:Ig domain-containing protein [Chthoniobacteraceae bacterium]
MKFLVLFLALCTPLLADTTWSNGGGDSSWSDPLNWSNGAPAIDGTNSNVTIGTQPADDEIGIDTGVEDTGVESLTFSAALTGTIDILAAGVEELDVFTNITNNSSQAVTFTLPVIANDQYAAALAYTTGGGLIFNGGLSVGAAPISASGAGELTLGSGAYTTLAIQDSGTFGAITGAATVNYNDSNLQFNFSTATVTPGTSWQLFQNTAGSPASVSFVGDFLTGSLAASGGLWSGSVGGYFFAFNQSTGVLSVNSAPTLTITTASPLGNGTTGVDYSLTFGASFGASPYSWTLASGTLPNGLSLAGAGLLSGTPTASGTFSFGVEVEDETTATDTMNFSMVVIQPLQITSTAATLASDIYGQAYSVLLSATGGSPGYTWSVKSGSIPQGLTLGGTGLLSGTPAASGNFTFVAQVEDASGAEITGTYSLDVISLLAITGNSTLASGTEGATYSAVLSATGGALPYGWLYSAGTLPGGLSISSGGVVSGTIATTGTYNFTAEVSDNSGQTESQGYTIVAVSPLTVTSATLLDGTEGAAYSQALQASGGTPGYQWTFSSGILPTGLAVTSAGLVSGTPEKTGTFQFIAKAKDTSGASVSGTFSLEVIAPLAITTATPVTSGSVSYNYSQTFAASGGQPPYGWSITGGATPGGLSLSGTGVLSGIPTQSGTYSFTAQAMDQSGAAVTKVFSVKISPVTMPDGTVGTFIALIDRQAAVNDGLGGLLSVTTTATGKVTGKIIQQGKSHSFKTSISSSGNIEPQITVTVPNGSLPALQLSLLLDGTAQSITGTVTTDGTDAAVAGWRNSYNAKSAPAKSLAGYYTFVMALSSTNDIGSAGVPQGDGYGKFTAGTGGTLTVSGKTADGQPFTTAGFVGPEGQIAVYQSLYANKGSLLGTLTLTTGTSLAANTVAGTLTWLKPADSSRTYGAGFGPTPLTAAGGYLGTGKSIVPGLPLTTESAALVFDDGGVAGAATNPDVDAFTFTVKDQAILPAAGSPGNPAKATLSISKTTGAISGKFTLVDGKLTRDVLYHGTIVPGLGGGVEAAGYFLLPQIPTTGETAKTSPILSGQVTIQQ